MEFEYEQAITQFMVACYKEAAKIIEFGPSSDRIALIKAILGTHARQVTNTQDQGVIEAQSALTRLLETQRDVRPKALTARVNDTHQANVAGADEEGPVPN